MNSILLCLTKWQIRGINGEYIRTQNVKLPDGKNQEVAIFSGESTLYTGQCTIVRTIILHESIFEDEQKLNYVVTHEVAHKKQWWGILLIPLIVICFFFAVLALAAALTSVFQSITGDLIQLVFFPLGLIISVLLIAIACAFSWLMEINADFQSIKLLGLKTYLDVKNKPSKLKHRRYQKVIYRMTHPPDNVTTWLWRKFHKS